MALTLTNNSPSAGYIAWTACNMQYNGVSYAIPAGNTNNIYVYWQKATPNAFQVSNTFPTLGVDDCIVFLNKNGIGLNVLTATALDGDLIVPGSIFASAIASNTITSNQIAASTIVGGDIASSTITSGLIAANAIGTAALAANAVTATQIAANTITAAQIAASTITTNEIAANTIVGGDIAANTITGGNIAASTITASNIAASTITAGLIAANAIGASAIAAGAITVDKLNVLAANKVNNFSTTGDVTTGWSAGGVSATDPSMTGMQPPMEPPNLSTATTGGSLPAGTYYVVYTYKNALGETTRSPEASITTTGSTSTITVSVPVWTSGVTSMCIYISTTSGAEKLQGTITGVTYTQTAALNTASAAPPATNTALGVSSSRGKVMKVTSNTNTQILANTYTIDPTQTYKVTLSMTNQPTGYSQYLANNMLYFGLNFYDASMTEIATVPFSVSSRTWGTALTNPYFYNTGAGVRLDGWYDMEAYMIGTTVTNAAEVPDGKNVSNHFRIPPNAVYAKIRFLNWNNAGNSVDAFFYSPSVIAVGSGQINASQITAGTLSAITITGSNITSQVSGKSDNVNLNGGSFVATAYNAAIDDNGFTDGNGGRVTTTIAPTSFKRYIRPETAAPTYDVDYTFEVTPTKLNLYASRNNYGNSSGIQIDVSKTIPAIQAMPSPGPNSLGKWQIYDITQVNFWRSNLSNLMPTFNFLDSSGYFGLNYPLTVSNGETHFASTSYSDPWSGKAAAVKAYGGIVSDWLGSTSLQSSGDFTLVLGNGQYLMANQGAGAVLWRSNYTRLVLHDQDPTCRIERFDGGSANLIVATINGSSDRKKKHKIAPFTSEALSKIKATQVYNYNFKDEPEETDLHLGIMAQEAPTDVVGHGGDTVDLYAMISLSWKAIQELSDELDKLKGGKKNVA